MGYEVAGGLGVKMADPDREVIVMVGDGSWLMMSSEIATSIQEGVRLTVVLIDNRGFGSIGGLSRSLGSEGYGTAYRMRGPDGELSGPPIELDLAANARSLGAHSVHVSSTQELAEALGQARESDRTTVIVIDCDPSRGVGSYESWWDVPVAEVSTMPAVARARADYERERARERPFPGDGAGG
jgi:3D-(3,5/4)-trihydroxycyclohexane-1,2-dione acylhydrolase (decyclizing)